jgi:hypothetical protein
MIGQLILDYVDGLLPPYGVIRPTWRIFRRKWSTTALMVMRAIKIAKQHDIAHRRFK